MTTKSTQVACVFVNECWDQQNTESVSAWYCPLCLLFFSCGVSCLIFEQGTFIKGYPDRQARLEALGFDTDVSIILPTYHWYHIINLQSIMLHGITAVSYARVRAGNGFGDGGTRRRPLCESTVSCCLRRREERGGKMMCNTNNDAYQAPA